MEAAAEGITLAWAPMLDVARDARWGRCAESPGEDPLLGAAFAVAMVEGYQGDDLAGAAAVMATAKHFAGYGLSESDRKSVVMGKRVSVSVDLGGRRVLKKKT